NALRDLLHELWRARMQFAGFLVYEERHGHTPLALTRQGPVRSVGDHGVQTRLAPCRIESRFFDALEGHFTKRGALGRLTIHARKPLARGAVDDGRLVPPAVHVAVLECFDLEQRTGVLKRLHNDGVGFPDRVATE